MDIREFISKKNILREDYDDNLWKLKKEYALSNNTVKVGDIVIDHMGAVKVEKILIYRMDEPSCIYRGIEYTKAGKPTKRGGRRDAYQRNLIKTPSSKQ